MTFKSLLELLKASATKWSQDNAPRLGASLAFYMLLSLAPLLILLVAICGFAFSEATAQARLLAQVHELAGTAGEKTVQMLIASATHPKSGIFATIVAVITLLSGASGVFIELRESLNTIWGAPRETSSNWKRLVRQRLASFGMVLGLGVLLVVSFVLSAALTIFERFFTGIFPIHIAIAGEIANVLISLASLSVLFALIFKYVPDVPIDWQDVGIGAGFTSVLFVIGKALLGLYFATVGVGSTYGAAGSLVALIVWVYYSAQIFFFGAIFTQIYAGAYGSRARKSARMSVVDPSLRARSQNA